MGLATQPRTVTLEPVSTAAESGSSMASWYSATSAAEISCSVILKGPSVGQLVEPWRTPDHERHHFPEAGPFDMAGLKTAVLTVRRAGQEFEIVISLSVTLPIGIAATGIETVADRDFAGDHLRPPADCRFILGVARTMNPVSNGPNH